jgi:hypothetical protein
VTGPPAVPPPSEPAVTGQRPDAGNLSPSDAPSRPRRGPFVCAAALTVVWCAILIVMAWRTANPVSLNRDQILRADLVVTGTVESEPAIGEVSVTREWKKNGLKGTIHVENLEDAKARRGATYLIPLSPSSAGYRVTEARLDNSAPHIYPATRAAIEQLEAILGNHSATK